MKLRASPCPNHLQTDGTVYEGFMRLRKNFWIGNTTQDAMERGRWEAGGRTQEAAFDHDKRRKLGETGEESGSYPSNIHVQFEFRISWSVLHLVHFFLSFPPLLLLLLVDGIIMTFSFSASKILISSTVRFVLVQGSFTIYSESDPHAYVL